MIDRNLTVTEAARNFVDLVNRTFYRGESTILMRSGEPVAMVVPVGGASVTGRDWLRGWREVPHLDPKDADDFGEILEGARKKLTAPVSPWD